MPSKHTQKKRRVFAGVKDDKPYIVFSGSKGAEIASIKTRNYASYGCGCCGLEVAFGTDVKGFKPMCPTCGSLLEETPDGVTKVTPVEDELTLAQCPYCSTSNVIDDRLLQQASIHCVGCGSQVTAADEVDHNIYSVDASEDTDSMDIEKLFESDPITSTTNNDVQNDWDDLDEVESDFDDSDANTEEACGDKKCKCKASASAKKVTKAGADDQPVELTKTLLDMDSNEIPVNLADVVPNDDAANVRLVSLIDNNGQPEVLALADDIAVMKLVKEDAGDKADLLANSSFLNVLETTAKAEGYHALASFGFKPVHANFQLGKVVSRSVKAALANVEDNYGTRLQEIEEDYAQSAAIALAALNTNFYRKDFGNPLLEDISATLNAHGVKQANQIANLVFASAGDSFIRSFMSLTRELMNKPVTVRNELARAIEQANPDLYEEGEDEGTSEYSEEDDTLAKTSVLASLSGANLRSVDRSPDNSKLTTASTPKISDEEVHMLASTYRTRRTI